MTDATADSVAPPAKKSRFGLVLGLVLAVAGAGGGFYAVRSGLLFPKAEKNAVSVGAKAEELADIAYVAMDPILISLGDGQVARLLKFRAELEVNASYRKEVELIMPRITDVLNGYLRAIPTEELTKPQSLTRLRAQMLRRVQVVTGKERVLDLLIMEFVLN
jgi:flagellar protein FliL